MASSVFEKYYGGQAGGTSAPAGRSGGVLYTGPMSVTKGKLGAVSTKPMFGTNAYSLQKEGGEAKGNWFGGEAGPYGAGYNTVFAGSTGVTGKAGAGATKPPTSMKDIGGSAFQQSIESARADQKAAGAEGEGGEEADTRTDLEKLYDDMIAQHQQSWAGTQEMGQANMAALQRRAAAMQGAMGRSVAGGFAGAMGGAYQAGMQNLMQARQVHEAAGRDLMIRKAEAMQRAKAEGDQGRAALIASVVDEGSAQSAVMGLVGTDPRVREEYEKVWKSYTESGSGHGEPWQDMWRAILAHGWI